MKKIISIVLISFFAFSAIEIYVTQNTPKSCCCSSAKMCACKHAGGACPLTLNGQSEKFSGDALIKIASCGAGNSPVVSPQFLKELYLEIPSQILFALPKGELFRLTFKHYDFLPAVSIDQPPKHFSFN